MFLLVASGLLLVAGGALAQIDCTGQPDGSYGYGCKSYTNCTGGHGYVVSCDADSAYNYQTGTCQPIATVPPPCGSRADCSSLADGKYPVMPDCRYYFTCVAGVFMGSNPCNNPPDTGDLVFDTPMQICNWQWSVPEPCGTYLPPTVAPSSKFKGANRKRRSIRN